jgi:prepilin-type N-terminal cleavage/methylation domain-containing protein
MQHARGFTLIEMMIAMAVIGILSAIAFPAYRDHVRRGQLPEAFVSLSDFRMRMEQYFQDNRTYANGGNCGAVLPAPQNPRFTYGCAINGNGYTITATGAAGYVNGFVFTINERNVRATTGMHADWGALPVDANTRWIDRRP